MIFLELGFRHVFPDGPDHILFILTLFPMVWRWRPILIQALVFTVAHSVTLGLAVSGVIPKAGWPGASSLVESIIALSIASLAF